MFEVKKKFIPIGTNQNRLLIVCSTPEIDNAKDAISKIFRHYENRYRATNNDLLPADDPARRKRNTPEKEPAPGFYPELPDLRVQRAGSPYLKLVASPKAVVGVEYEQAFWVRQLQLTVHERWRVSMRLAEKIQIQRLNDSSVAHRLRNTLKAECSRLGRGLVAAEVLDIADQVLGIV